MRNEPSPTRRSKRWFRLILAVLGLLLGAVLAEVLLRVTGTAPEVGATSYRQYCISKHPEITYELAPGTTMGIDRINSLGYRGPLVPLVPAEGTRRVVVIGDSIAEGMGTSSYSDTFPAVLERSLSERGPPAEVVSLGVNGYDTVQEVATLEHKGLAFHPELVILQFCTNDVLRDDGALGKEILERVRHGNKVDPAWANPVLLHSALYRFIKYRALRWYLDPRLRQSWEYRVTVGFEQIMGGFEDLAELQEEHGFEVLVVIFPKFTGGLNPYRLADLHAQVAVLAGGHGFHLLDLLETFRLCAENHDGRAWRDHLHPDVNGHRCAGEAIANEILRAGLIRSDLEAQGTHTIDGGRALAGAERAVGEHAPQ